MRKFNEQPWGLSRSAINARKGGGQYLDDWHGTIKGAMERSKHAATPKDERRPFDPTKRFDAMAFYKRVWRRATAPSEFEPERVTDLRIRDPRHTAASLMLSSGMPIAMVSRQLGHASVSTTDLIYGGLLRESIDTADDEFGEWYAKQPKAAPTPPEAVPIARLG